MKKTGRKSRREKAMGKSGSARVKAALLAALMTFSLGLSGSFSREVIAAGNGARSSAGNATGNFSDDAAGNETDDSASLEEKTLFTVQDQIVVFGESPEGSVILISVYNYNYGEDKQILYAAQHRVGKSGLYELAVPLPVLGKQYVQLIIRGKETMRAYYRYAADVPDMLTGIHVNVYDWVRGRLP